MNLTISVVSTFITLGILLATVFTALGLFRALPLGRAFGWLLLWVVLVVPPALIGTHGAVGWRNIEAYGFALGGAFALLVIGAPWVAVGAYLLSQAPHNRPRAFVIGLVPAVVWFAEMGVAYRLFRQLDWTSPKAVAAMAAAQQTVSANAQNAQPPGDTRPSKQPAEPAAKGTAAAKGNNAAGPTNTNPTPASPSGKDTSKDSPKAGAPPASTPPNANPADRPSGPPAPGVARQATPGDPKAPPPANAVAQQQANAGAATPVPSAMDPAPPTPQTDTGPTSVRLALDTPFSNNEPRKAAEPLSLVEWPFYLAVWWGIPGVIVGLVLGRFLMVKAGETRLNPEPVDGQHVGDDTTTEPGVPVPHAEHGKARGMQEEKNDARVTH